MPESQQHSSWNKMPLLWVLLILDVILLISAVISDSIWQLLLCILYSLLLIRYSKKVNDQKL